MDNFFNLNKLVVGATYEQERKLIWLYLWLLIFEGALRKWFLPDLQQPLVLIREPIVIYLFFLGIQRGWLKSCYVTTMMIVSTICFLLTLIIGHHNLIVACFGWRIYFFHFSFVFIMGKVLTRDDILKMTRFMLYISIPMTILIILQFFSPQTAWVNRGIGGNMDGAGFGGAMGYYRPSGTFSFISGLNDFQGVVGCLLFYYLVANRYIGEKNHIPYWILLIMLIGYLIAIPTCISRTQLLQSVVYFLSLCIAMVCSQRVKLSYIPYVIGMFILIGLLLSSGMVDTQLEVFNTRIETASEIEGGMEGTIGNRYFGSFLRGILNPDLPICGYGLGLGTNFGAKFMGGDWKSFGFNGEEEWSRVTGECGIILGCVILWVRLFFSFIVLYIGYRLLFKNRDILPWMLSIGVLLKFSKGMWAVPTNLGFSLLFAGLALAAIRTSTPVVPQTETKQKRKIHK